MSWLLWKEFRLQRMVLGCSLFLAIAPYSFPIYWMLRADGLREAWRGAAAVSMVLSVLGAALLAGNAVACERADRSAQFQAYQPISRRHILLSKMLFPIATLLTIWLINAVILGVTTASRGEVMGIALFLGAASMCALGVGWLVSAFQDSPTFASAAGLVAPLLLGALISTVAWMMRSHAPQLVLVTITYSVLALTTGAVTFVVGCVHYLRRVEP